MSAPEGFDGTLSRAFGGSVWCHIDTLVFILWYRTISYHTVDANVRSREARRSQRKGLAPSVPLLTQGSL